MSDWNWIAKGCLVILLSALQGVLVFAWIYLIGDWKNW